MSKHNGKIIYIVVFSYSPFPFPTKLSIFSPLTQHYMLFPKISNEEGLVPLSGRKSVIKSRIYQSNMHCQQETTGFSKKQSELVI